MFAVETLHIGRIIIFMLGHQRVPFLFTWACPVLYFFLRWCACKMFNVMCHSYLGFHAQKVRQLCKAQSRLYLHLVGDTEIK